MIIGVVGLGLIGGSLALSLKDLSYVDKIIGSDKSSIHEKKALNMGLVDSISNQETLIKESDVILLAIPVHHIANLLPSILEAIHSKQVVIDFGSTKAAICSVIEHHSNRGQFVAAHPMAGTENTGPEAALRGLFTNKVNIICEKDFSNGVALEVANKIFDSLELKTIYMNAEEHDKHIAYVSHLSHISSFMLGITVLDKEKDEKNIFNMAGSGFQSTVRLAMSSPEMWSPIFDQNADNIDEALGTYIEYLQNFRNCLKLHDQDGMKHLMKEANVIRKILKPNDINT